MTSIGLYALIPAKFLQPQNNQKDETMPIDPFEKLKLEQSISEFYALESYGRRPMQLRLNGIELRKLAHIRNNEALTKFLKNNEVIINPFSLKHPGKEDTPLMIAASRGNTDAVRTLLKHRASPNLLNNKKVSPLMAASLNGYKKIVIALLKYEAERNAADENGDTSLMLAASKGRVDIVKTLLKCGADPHLINKNGANALMYAASNGNEEIVIALLEAGIDKNAADNDGMTALMFAAMNVHLNIAQILINAGANKYAIDKDGDTALIIAEQYGHNKLRAPLEKQEIFGRFARAYKDSYGNISLNGKTTSDHWQEIAAFETDTGELIEMNANHEIEPHIMNGQAFFRLIDTRNFMGKSIGDAPEEILEGIIINMLKDHQGTLHSPYGSVSSTWKEVQIFETTTGHIIELTPQHVVEYYINENQEKVYILKTPANIDNLKKAENTEEILESCSGFYIADEMPPAVFTHNGQYNIRENASDEERAAAQRWIAQQEMEEEEDDSSMKVDIPHTHSMQGNIDNPSPLSGEEMCSNY